ARSQNRGTLRTCIPEPPRRLPDRRAHQMSARVTAILFQGYRNLVERVLVFVPILQDVGELQPQLDWRRRCPKVRSEQCLGTTEVARLPAAASDCDVGFGEIVDA